MKSMRSSFSSPCSPLARAHPRRALKTKPLPGVSSPRASLPVLYAIFWPRYERASSDSLHGLGAARERECLPCCLRLAREREGDGDEPFDSWAVVVRLSRTSTGRSAGIRRDRRRIPPLRAFTIRDTSFFLSPRPTDPALFNEQLSAMMMCSFCCSTGHDPRKKKLLSL
ncbi:hypothetical protein DFH09DRAFT_574695 [Mycena vulgaris]|nr:hypothetical protein DFH09DRAFT_574695 [Mycena vulgaris]